MSSIRSNITLSRVSWTLMFICACEAILWFAPVLTASSQLVVSQHDRAGALAYYTLGNQIGATDAALMIQAQQRSIIATGQVASRQVMEEFHLQRKFAMATNSAHKSGVSLLGGLALTSGVLLLSLARGSGLASARDSGGGRRSGLARGGNKGGKKKAASAGDSTDGEAVNNAANNNGVAAMAAGSATLAAAAAVVVVKRGGGGSALTRGVRRTWSALAPNGGSLASARMYSSKRAPVSEALARKEDPATCGMDPHARYHAPAQKAASVQPQVEQDLSKEALAMLDDVAVANLVRDGTLPAHALENRLGDLERAVHIRRLAVAGDSGALDNLPYQHYDYSNVVGACAENVLGYMPVPVGVAGPVRLDDEMVHIPMATTEGCLIASTHRGCKAITESGGAQTVLTNDGMTRAPSVRFASAARAGEVMAWLSAPDNVQLLRDAFESTTRFGKLLDVDATQAGRTVYVRFRAKTGDAMGMNMISKGVDCALNALMSQFPDADVMALSGNMCTDKKPSAINWINGRGKSVIAEAVIKADVVERVLKTNVDALVELNISKNLVGSAMAGSIGGFNAHASNIVTAMYIATGQDPAQNVESSNCITLMERDGDDLRISVTMPSIECAAIGGGTHLPAQASALSLMGCQGAHPETPGANAQKFARCVAVATLAGELSLMSALTSNDLVRSHMELNRKK